MNSALVSRGFIAQSHVRFRHHGGVGLCHPAVPVVPLVKQTILRSSGFGGCLKQKSADQHNVHLVKSHSCNLILLRETNLQLAFEDYFFLEPEGQKKQTCFQSRLSSTELKQLS